MIAARQIFRLVAEGLAAGGVLGVAVVWPPVSKVPPADAVVLLAGDGARLPPALRLMERKVAPTLVVAGEPDVVEVIELCRQPQPFEVVCLRRTPDNTRTEAQAAGQLAEDRRWRALVVVTSKFHIARAGLHFRRCFDGVVATSGEYPLRFAGRQVMHEWLGLVHASLLSRGC